MELERGGRRTGGGERRADREDSHHMCRVLLPFLYIVPLCSPVLPSMGGGKGYGERKDHGKEHVRVKEGEKLGEEEEEEVLSGIK